MSFNLFGDLPLGRLPSIGLQLVTTNFNLLSGTLAIMTGSSVLAAFDKIDDVTDSVSASDPLFVLWSCQDTPVIALSLEL